mmetsp:Transcript_67594/g.144637  ORF Transcript_67594/g.144637 Transcript_67594/m.144637 type:complete len:87 (-) Transcript_67594:2205-2465(-)
MESLSMIVDKRCAIAMHVPFTSAMSVLRAFCTSRSLLVSSAAVASSRSRIFGRRTMALAMVRRCFCPPESSPAGVSKRKGFRSRSW